MGVYCLVVDTGQRVCLGLQQLEDALFLMKRFIILHEDDLFLLTGIHHDVLLIGGHFI